MLLQTIIHYCSNDSLLAPLCSQPKGGTCYMNTQQISQIIFFQNPKANLACSVHFLRTRVTASMHLSLLYTSGQLPKLPCRSQLRCLLHCRRLSAECHRSKSLQCISTRTGVSIISAKPQTTLQAATICCHSAGR